MAIFGLRIDTKTNIRKLSLITSPEETSPDTYSSEHEMYVDPNLHGLASARMCIMKANS